MVPSLLPPATKRKMDRLPEGERREFIQELIGRYEYRLRHLDKKARELSASWSEAQRQHFDNVVDELYGHLEHR